MKEKEDVKMEFDDIEFHDTYIESMWVADHSRMSRSDWFLYYMFKFLLFFAGVKVYAKQNERVRMTFSKWNPVARNRFKAYQKKKFMEEV
jgi:hypothetical protein